MGKIGRINNDKTLALQGELIEGQSVNRMESNGDLRVSGELVEGIFDIDNYNASFSEGTLTDVEVVNEGLELDYNSSLEFLKNAEHRLSVPAGSFPTGNYMTVEFWNYGTDDITSEYKTTVITIRDSSGNRVMTIHLPYLSTVYWDCGDVGDGDYDRISKSLDIETELKGWHHWAFTKNAVSGDMKIYLDGNLWHSGTGRNESMSASIVETFGKYSGRLSDFRVWSEERTQTEIQNNMYNWLIGNETNLELYYKFDDGRGLSVKDYTSNDNNATIESANWIKYYLQTGWYKTTTLNGTGNRLSPQLDLSTVGTIGSSSISWGIGSAGGRINSGEFVDHYINIPSLSSSTYTLKFEHVPDMNDDGHVHTGIFYLNSNALGVKTTNPANSNTDLNWTYQEIDVSNLVIGGENHLEWKWDSGGDSGNIRNVRIEDGNGNIYYDQYGLPYWDIGIGYDGSSSARQINENEVVIETSTDGGSTWDTCTNGGSIPNIEGANTLDVRQALSTNDTTVTPVLESLEISINHNTFTLDSQGNLLTPELTEGQTLT